MIQVDRRQYLANIVVLISIGMLFATLFMGYAIYRTSGDVIWKTLPGQIFYLPLLSTFFVLVSSYFFYVANRALEVMRGEETSAEWRRHFKNGLFCGLLFMFSQGSFWWMLKQQGWLPSSGLQASVLYGFTWIHVIHVIISWLYVWGAYTRITGFFTPTYAIKREWKNVFATVKSAENVWHFLGLIWVLMFLVLFLI
jgi:cytochrome c oxidase subunit 3